MQRGDRASLTVGGGQGGGRDRGAMEERTLEIFTWTLASWRWTPDCPPTSGCGKKPRLLRYCWTAWPGLSFPSLELPYAARGPGGAACRWRGVLLSLASSLVTAC